MSSTGTMVKILVSLGVLLAFVLDPAKTQSSNPAKALSHHTNRFALNLYQALRNGSENIVVSPISVQIVLVMALIGARGSTATEIAELLNILHFERQKVLDGHKAIITRLDDENLQLAATMFVEKSLNLLPKFENIISHFFLTEAKGEFFSRNPQGARAEINSWVEKKTNNKIKDLLSTGSISELTKLVLVNAIHFKGKWEKRFDKSLTSDLPFYLTPEKTIKVPMMSTTDTYRYMESPKLDAKILQMYYTGRNYSMIIFLPNKVDGLSQLEDKLVDLDYNDELSGLTETKVTLILPKFKLENGMKLNEALKKMGMSTAFSQTADFSGIANTPLAISEVVQKAFIEVDEEGTEAAVASGASLELLTSAMEPLPVFKCDRPFFFYLIEHSTDVALFFSRVQKFRN